MKPSVILYKALPDDLLQRLQEHFTVHQVANLSPQTVEQNAAIFSEAEGLLGSNENVDAALLEKMPKLRATSTISVGYDNFDVDAITARKILLMHTPTVLTETVADTLMALVPNLGTLPCAIIILFLKYPTDPVWKIEVVIPFPMYMVLL